MKILLNNNREINDECVPYFIAEVNTSHFGDIEKAKKLIDAVKKAGADCVKFQSWSTDSLYSNDFYKENPMAKRFVKKFSLDENEQKILAEYCESLNIDFASTPYSIDEANFLINKCKVPFIKVASMDINNYPYLRYLAKTESAIIISSGMANFDEISKAIKLLECEGAKNIILLHCISIYPAAPELINLNHIRFLKDSFPNIAIGYSDHTLGIEVGIASVAMGACVIEKHFTLDSSVIGMDNQMAMEEKELTQMINCIKNTFHALGTKNKIVSQEELDQGKKMRRSLVAAKEMKIGDVLTEDCLEAKRPGTGICVSEWDTYLNKKITKAISKDSLLTKEHFE
jgi:N-acetylneuraminate synthase